MSFINQSDRDQLGSYWRSYMHQATYRLDDAKKNWTTSETLVLSPVRANLGAKLTASTFMQIPDLQ